MENLADDFLFYAVFSPQLCTRRRMPGAALRGADRTAYEGGQVTLDPAAHPSRTSRDGDTSPHFRRGLRIALWVRERAPTTAAGPSDTRCARAGWHWPDRERFISSSAHLSLIGIVIAWQLFPGIFDAIFTCAINLLYPGVSYS